MDTQKIVNGLKTIGSYLPIANEFNLFNFENSLHYSFGEILGRVSITGLSFSYLLLGVGAGIWTPKQYQEFDSKIREIAQEKIQYKNSVESNFDSLFQDAKTYEDSLKVWNEYQLPLGRNPSFEEKEKIYNKSLEERTKLSN